MTCGIKQTQEQIQRIVGGPEVTPFSIPWQVRLVVSGSNIQHCGGTLISPQHVLTAAHCMRGSSYEVIVGEHNITDPSDGTRHAVCKYTIHPQYEPDDCRNPCIPNNNDFAVAHLQQPVELGTLAALACLPAPRLGGDFLAAKTMTVSGWGRLAYQSSFPHVLHSVNVPGITHLQCSEKYSETGYIISSNMICAGDVSDGGIGSCHGDSGGKTRSASILIFITTNLALIYLTINECMYHFFAINIRSVDLLR